MYYRKDFIFITIYVYVKLFCCSTRSFLVYISSFKIKVAAQAGEECQIKVGNEILHRIFVIPCFFFHFLFRYHRLYIWIVTYKDCSRTL